MGRFNFNMFHWGLSDAPEFVCGKPQTEQHIIYHCAQGRRQRKMSGGNKTKKTETYSYNFRSLWHTKNSIIFSTPKAWAGEHSFVPTPTKTAESEVKNRHESAEKQNQNIYCVPCYFCDFSK